MLLSTETGGLRIKYDDKIAIKMIKDAGFDAFDYSFCYLKGQPEKDMLDDNYIERAHELRAYADEIGIVCNQSHAPLDFKYTDETDLSNENFLRNVRAIEVASILGAKSIIFHGLGIVYAHDIDYIEYNTKYLRSYLPYCEKYNMKISYENSCAISKDMKAIPIPGVHTAEEYMRFIDSLDNRWFNICVDTGHLAVVGMEPVEFISGLTNDYLCALHIHENDGTRDQHLIPYTLGKFNWDKITEALKKIDYKGDFTLESSTFFAYIPDELLPSALKYAADLGRLLIKKIEEA